MLATGMFSESHVGAGQICSGPVPAGDVTLYDWLNPATMTLNTVPGLDNVNIMQSLSAELGPLVVLMCLMRDLVLLDE